MSFSDERESKEHDLSWILEKLVRNDQECLQLIQQIGINSHALACVPNLLTFIASKGYLSSLRAILQQFTQPDRSLDVVTPLIWNWGVQTTAYAALNHKKEMVQALLYEFDCPIDMDGITYAIPLFTDSELIDILIPLLQTRITIFDEDSFLLNIAQAACKHGRKNLVDRILQLPSMSSNASVHNVKLLKTATMFGQEDIIRWIMDQIQNSTSKSKIAGELCMDACAYGFDNIIEYLYPSFHESWTLDEKAKIESNMLFFATINGKVTCLEWCIRQHKKSNKSCFEMSSDLIKALLQTKTINTSKCLELFRTVIRKVDAETLALMSVDERFQDDFEYWWALHRQNLKKENRRNNHESVLAQQVFEIVHYAASCTETPFAEIQSLQVWVSLFPLTISQIIQVLQQCIEFQAEHYFLSFVLQLAANHRNSQEVQEEIQQLMKKCVQRELYHTLLLLQRFF